MIAKDISNLAERYVELFGESVMVKDDKIYERSVILSDTVSLELWGGSRGWEKATDEQFQSLVRRLKEKLRNEKEIPGT